MKLKAKRLTKTSILPEKAHKHDAAFDLYADETAFINYGETKIVSTGIAVEIPEGYYGQIVPRSGLTSKTKIRVQNGTIDSNYRGCLGVIVDNSTSFNSKTNAQKVVQINKNDRIAQLIIHKLPEFEIEEVDELGTSERGTNGFGSTGK